MSRQNRLAQCSPLDARCCFSQQNTSSSPLQRRELWVWPTTKSCFPARAESEEFRLRKDRLEVLANTAQTLREALSPNVSPVAEANSSVFLLFAGVLPLMPGTLREIQTSCPACHFAFHLEGFPCSRRFFFYTTGSARVQGGVYEVGAECCPFLKIHTLS